MHHVLNECLIDRGSSPSMVRLELYVDGHHITTVRVSTPLLHAIQDVYDLLPWGSSRPRWFRFTAWQLLWHGVRWWSLLIFLQSVKTHTC